MAVEKNIMWKKGKVRCCKNIAKILGLLGRISWGNRGRGQKFLGKNQDFK